MKEETSTPLFSKLINYVKEKPISFHVPGHKNGEVTTNEQRKWFDPLLKIDVTELSGLDDLHDPTGVIAEAEHLTSKFFQSKRSFFLVGGSTVGNLAMILASCEENDTILVQRNCHKSVINGIKLAKANPVFLIPEYHVDSQLYTGLSIQSVKETINRFPYAKALVLTNPSYYGIATPLHEIIEYAHKAGIAVLVDEAHGAHFAIGEPFPIPALHQGADVVVQSAHKTLPAMTMASYLHFNSSIVNFDKLTSYLNMLQSSSPSYPLMASLDIARNYLQTINEEMKMGIIQSIDEFKEKLKEIKQIHVLEIKEQHLLIDPLKVVVETRCPLNGFEIQAALEQVGIYTELADDVRVLFVMPLAPLEEIDLVIKKMKEIFCSLPIINRSKSFKSPVSFQQPFSVIEGTYKELNKVEKKRVPLEQSVGRIASTNIIPYPPGIPLLMEGEKIQSNHIQEIQKLAYAGAKFQGNKNIILEGIEVFL